MAAGDIALKLLITADVAGALGPVGALATGLGAVVVEAVKSAGDFQQATNLLITSAGELPKNIDMIRRGLLKMSVDTATSTDELTKGMFNVESANYHGADAILVETAAAEGAKVENADLAAVTDVLTTAMHNYHEPASQAVDVMNSFRMSASIGKMRMDDLTGALTNVLPIASQAGVKLSDVEAALSTMSLAGDKGAIAGTHLNQMLTYLLAPSSKATKALTEVGLTTQQISDEMKVSLPGAVDMITQAVGEKFPVGSAKYLATLAAIVGGNKSMKAILELSGQSLKTFTDDASQLGPTMTANSKAIDGWNVVQSNFNFKLGQAQDAVNVLFIKLGTYLLPVLGQVLDAITPLVTSFTDWITSTHAVSDVIEYLNAHVQILVPVLSGVAAILLALLIPAMLTFASGVIAATWPFITLGLAVAGIVAILMQLNPGITTIQGAFNMLVPVVIDTAAALTVFFLPALIASGVEAVISAAKITYNFVASLIMTGAEGWGAAIKLGALVLAFIASGVQAGIAGAVIAANFIINLVTTAATAGATAFALTGSLIPALYAVGVAAYAAMGPLGLILGAIALIIGALALMKQKADEWKIGMTGDFNSAGDMIQRSTGRIIATADQMKQGVTQATDDMKKTVTGDVQATALNVIKDSTMMSDTASKLWKKFNGNATADLASLDSSTISYMNSIAAYIDSQSANAARIANENFAKIHVPNMSGSNVMRNFNDSSTMSGHAAGILNNPIGHWAMVGERGPETMYIPQGASILPNGFSSGGNNAFALGNGGQTIMVQVQPQKQDIYLDRKKVGEGVMQYAQQEIRISGNVRR